MQSFSTDYDILIVGAGIVGATLACALANNGLRIALIDKQKADTALSSAYEARVSAINRAAENIFRRLGVWQHLPKERIADYQAMHVWDAMGEGQIHFDCADIAEANLGYIIENHVLSHGLAQVLKNCRDVEIIAPTELQVLQLDANQAQLTCQDGRCLQAEMIVGADGSYSWVRQQAELPVTSGDYQQTAIITIAKTQLPHQQTAWQRFLPTGPLAFLPLIDAHHSAIVWSTTKDHAQALLTMQDQEFQQALAQALQKRLGEVESVAKRQSFPLHMQHAKQYVAERVALIGDAAHTIHPLAGQGLNLGLLDAACLTQVLLEAKQKQQKLGSYKTLRRYERWRKGDNLAMLTAMAGFKWLFSNEQYWLAKLRNSGLAMVNHLPPVKNLLMRYALGINEDLPNLAVKHRSA